MPSWGSTLHTEPQSRWVGNKVRKAACALLGVGGAARQQAAVSREVRVLHQDVNVKIVSVEGGVTAATHAVDRFKRGRSEMCDRRPVIFTLGFIKLTEGYWRCAVVRNHWIAWERGADRELSAARLLAPSSLGPGGLDELTG